MSNIESELSLLKQRLENAAFLIGKGGAEKEAHSEVIQSLLLVAEIESTLTSPGVVESLGGEESHEANKVRRRLRLWAGRQNQINTKILNAYLKLQREGKTIITEQDLRKELSDEKSFDSNFAQMKIIADRNHGKVFDQHGDRIAIWEPVAADIREYEKIIFGER